MTNAAHVRAAHYRQQAAQLRDLADIERPGRLRNNLLNIARQYDGLAESVEFIPPAFHR